MQSAELLHTIGLRSTEPRRLVIDTLQKSKKPLSASALHRVLSKKGYSVNMVTVYRVIEMLIAKHLAHEHPCGSGYSLCTLPDHTGHHAFLHCTSCGRIQEFHDASLCQAEQKLATKAKFSAQNHISELTGLCQFCTH